MCVLRTPFLELVYSFFTKSENILFEKYLYVLNIFKLKLNKNNTKNEKLYTSNSYPDPCVEG